MKSGIIACVLLLSVTSCKSQSVDRAGVAFYNVENLMDTIDNPLKLDDEFTPGSEKAWNTEKYLTKLQHIAEVLVTAGQDLPVLIGLCEIENRKVLEDLIGRQELQAGNYGIAQFDSPDARGIDCALLYRKDRFEVKDAFPVQVDLSMEGGGATRDILYVSGVFKADKSQTLVHVFVNHWPSRYEGEEVTRPRRIKAASVLKRQIDSLNNKYDDPVIIVMGDFNDSPFDESLMITLSAATHQENFADESLVNLVAEFQKTNDGSYNYKGNWQALDQMIVSECLLTGNSRLQADKRKVRFIRNDFQMYNNTKYGPTPNRTYGGSNYYGGYSDHLPVYFEIVLTDL